MPPSPRSERRRRSVQLVLLASLLALALVAGLASAPARANGGTATLTLTKQAAPDTDRLFSFVIDPGNVEFNLGDGQSRILSDLAPGDYLISELVPDGWVLAQIGCTPNWATRAGNAVSLQLAASDDVTCVFTNEQRAALTVVKEAEPDTPEVFPLTLDPGAVFAGAVGSAGSGDGRFNSPAGVAVDDAGNVYVTDQFHHRIEKFNNAGAFLLVWGWGVGDGTAEFQICAADCQTGVQGSGNGQFSFPAAVAVDGAGHVYVADQFNHRIQKFDLDGNYLDQWGSHGYLGGPGEFEQPQGVAADAAGNVYVADFYNGRIQKFDGDGNFLGQWNGAGSGTLLGYPAGVAVDVAGNVYVADQFESFVMKFDSDGTFIAAWGWDVVKGNAEVGYEVCAAGQDCQGGRQGSGAGQLNNARGIAVDDADRVYVADWGAARVQIFDSDGFLLGAWDRFDVPDGHFDPFAVAFDGPAVYVADNSYERLQKFNLTTTSLGDGGSHTFAALKPGTYVVSETPVAGWQLGSADCGGAPAVVDGGRVRVTLPPGETVVCTLHNVPVALPDGRVTVVKEVTGAPAAGDWRFAFSGDLGPFDLTKAAPQVTFADLPAGEYAISEAAAAGFAASAVCDNGDSAPDGNLTVTVAAGEAVTCTFRNTGADVFLSAAGGVARSAGAPDVAYTVADVLKWDGAAWTKGFDGRAAGLTPDGTRKHDISALWIPDPEGDDVALAFAHNARNVPGITGKVDGMDVVWWDGATFALWFDGQDVGLNALAAEKIDGLHALPGVMAPPAVLAAAGGSCQSYLLLSTQGPGRVTRYDGAPLRFGGEDVLGFCLTQSGAQTRGKWTLVLDGSAEGLRANALASLWVAPDGATLYLTTQGAFAADGAAGGHSMVYAYDFATGRFRGPLFSAPAAGLGAKVDGLDLSGELP